MPDAFPEVFAQGGFDVVVGNAPYIRQELLSPFKPWLEAHYEVFHGMADLHVYFYELGVRLLKPGGLLCFIVTNKRTKAGYGEPLRRFFSDKAWVRSVVDYGHAKQIFEGVDVFPSIILVEKPNEAPKPKTVRLCTTRAEEGLCPSRGRQRRHHRHDVRPAGCRHQGGQSEARFQQAETRYTDYYSPRPLHICQPALKWCFVRHGKSTTR